MEEKHTYRKGIIIWLICAIFFLYEFFLRTILGTYQHPIMYDLNLNTFEFSVLSSTVFLFIYGIMQIPVGIIIDNIGLKKSLLFACISCTIATFLMSYSYGFYVAILSRGLMALGASFGFICLLVAVNNWLPSKYKAIFIGLSQFIGTLGPMLSAGPLESFADCEYGCWRNMFLILSVVGMILFILIFLFVDNKKKQNRETILLSRPETTKSYMKKLLSSSQPWFIAFFSASVYFAVEYLSENEGRNFLTQSGASKEMASYIITLSWLGYGVSAPIFGFISDYFQRRKPILILGATLGLIGTCLILYSHNLNYVICGFILLGVSASSQTVGFAIIAEQFKEKFVALGFGLNNAVIMSVAAINSPIMGIILENQSGESGPNIENYLSVFQILLFISVVGLIFAVFFIKETYCKSAVDFTKITPIK